MNERKWIDIEPSEQNLASYDFSKNVISLLRHNQTLQREQDGAIEFYRIKFYLRNHSSQVQHWSDDRRKACLAEEVQERRYQYCSDNSGTILYLRALQGHSDVISLILCYKQCNNSSNGLIPGGQDLSRRQTVFFLPIDPRDKDHKDTEHIDFSVPRRAKYVHGRGIKTRYSGFILILRSKRD